MHGREWDEIYGKKKEGLATVDRNDKNLRHHVSDGKEMVFA